MNELEKINRASILGGFAYLVELTMRLYVHRTPDLDRHTHEPSPILEEKFFSHFNQSISQENKSKISNCRDFRNRLIHTKWWNSCSDAEYEKEFSDVREVLALIRKLTGLAPLKMKVDLPNEIDWALLDFVEQYVVRVYRDVAVAATAYEIVMRKFASEFPELQSIAYDADKTLQDVQGGISNHLKFSPETADLVENCRQARNKILHCDFFAAKKIAMKLAPNKIRSSGNVLVLDGTKNWESQPVSESTRKGAGAFGWALEGLSSGAAEATFEALSVITQKIYSKDFVFGPKS